MYCVGAGARIEGSFSEIPADVERLLGCLIRDRD